MADFMKGIYQDDQEDGARSLFTDGITLLT